MKRLVIVWLIGLMMLSLLSACAGPAESPEEAHQKQIKELLTQISISQDRDEQENAFISLIELNAKGAIPGITKLLQDSDSGVRRWAVWALKNLDAKEAIPEITKLLQDNDPDVRESVVYTLGKLDAKEAIPNITRLLQDNIPYVRSSAIETLGDLGAKEAIPELVKVLDDDDQFARGITAMVLVELGAKDKVTTKSIEDIKQLFKCGDEVSSRARAALKELGVTLPESEENK